MLNYILPCQKIIGKRLTSKVREKGISTRNVHISNWRSYCEAIATKLRENPELFIAELLTL